MSEPRPKGMASLSAWQHEEKSVHILLGATRRRVAETQRYRQLSAALHKFKVRSDAAALYLVLREAMPPAFSDVSSLNLAAFPAAKFLRTRRRRASPNLSGNGYPDVIPSFLCLSWTWKMRPGDQGSPFRRGNGKRRHTRRPGFTGTGRRFGAPWLLGRRLSAPRRGGARRDAGCRGGRSRRRCAARRNPGQRPRPPR